MSTPNQTEKKPHNTPRKANKAQADARRAKRQRRRNRRAEVRARTNPVVTQVRTQQSFGKHGVAYSKLNVYAKARALPELVAPQRMPYQSRNQTDVKHLWHLATVKNQRNATAGTQTEYPAFLGDTAINSGQHIMFLGKSAVAPVVYCLSNAAMVAGEVIFMKWWPAVPPRGDYSKVQPGSYIIDCGISTHAGAAAQEYTPQAAKAYVQPCFTSSTTDIKDFVSLPSGYTAKAAPGEIENTPTFVSHDRYYALNHGHTMRVVIESASFDSGGAQLAFPGQAAIHMTLLRYNGEDMEDDAGTYTFTMGSGSKANRFDLDETSGIGGGEATRRPGYYRFRVDKVVMAPDASSMLVYPDIALRVFSACYSNTDRFWVQPAIPTFYDAHYVFRKVRITAASMRATNTTPAMFIGGDAYACRLGDDNQSSNLGAGWYNTSPQLIAQYAGSRRVGYTGNAVDGLYTWMEQYPQDEDFLDCTAEMSDYPATVRPKVDLDRYIGATHAFMFDTSQMSVEASSSFTARLRVDVHLEFMSNSPLANNSIALGSITDLENAAVVLALAPLCYENPSHLAKIWEVIKRSALPVLKAAGSAAARVALESMLAAV